MTSLELGVVQGWTAETKGQAWDAMIVQREYSENPLVSY